MKLVVNTGRAVATVARELGVTEQTLGRWVNAHRIRQQPKSAPVRLGRDGRIAGCGVAAQKSWSAGAGRGCCAAGSRRAAGSNDIGAIRQAGPIGACGPS